MLDHNASLNASSLKQQFIDRHVSFTPTHYHDSKSTSFFFFFFFFALSPYNVVCLKENQAKNQLDSPCLNLTGYHRPRLSTIETNVVSLTIPRWSQYYC